MKINTLSYLLISAFLICFLSDKNFAEETSTKKIGVLLVNHGSHSETWRNALTNLEDSVKGKILSNPNISGIKTAFMEYNEPSIATRLKEFDKENYSDIILVPIFLTVSSHSFDDIPTIIGQKNDRHSIELLKIEKIERYTPQANVHITPLLDFTDILEKNVLRRVKGLSENETKEGLVMIAYGDRTYDKEWSILLEDVGNYVKSNTKIKDYSYGWCGHVAHYNPDSTTVAINEIIKKKEKAIVIPILVAHDEMFQIKIIGDGIAKIENAKEKVIYKPDAILPDVNIQNWIIEVSNNYEDKISSNIVKR